MVKAWKPKLELEEDQFPGWLFEKLAELCKASPFGNGRVSMGFGFDSLFLPKPMVIDIFNNVRAMGVKTITTHSVATLAGTSTSTPCTPLHCLLFPQYVVGEDTLF